jgi:hypothetical protein
MKLNKLFNSIIHISLISHVLIKAGIIYFIKSSLFLLIDNAFINKLFKFFLFNFQVFINSGAIYLAKSVFVSDLSNT